MVDVKYYFIVTLFFLVIITSCTQQEKIQETGMEELPRMETVEELPEGETVEPPQSDEQFCYYLNSQGDQMHENVNMQDARAVNYQGTVSSAGKFTNRCNDDFSSVLYEICGEQEPYTSGSGVAKGLPREEQCQYECNPENIKCCHVTVSDLSCNGYVLVNTTTIDCYPGNPVVTEKDCSEEGKICQNHACLNAEEAEPFCHYLALDGTERPSGWQLNNFTQPYTYQGIITEKGTFKNSCSNDFSSIIYQVCGNPWRYISGSDVKDNIFTVDCDLECNGQTNQCCEELNSTSYCEWDTVITSTFTDCHPGNQLITETDCTEEDKVCDEGECV